MAGNKKGLPAPSGGFYEFLHLIGEHATVDVNPEGNLEAVDGQNRALDRKVLGISAGRRRHVDDVEQPSEPCACRASLKPIEMSRLSHPAPRDLEDISRRHGRISEQAEHASQWQERDEGGGGKGQRDPPEQRHCFTGVWRRRIWHPETSNNDSLVAKEKHANKKELR
jgi:hypothetical protein